MDGRFSLHRPPSILHLSSYPPPNDRRPCRIFALPDVAKRLAPVPFMETTGRTCYSYRPSLSIGPLLHPFVKLSPFLSVPLHRSRRRIGIKAALLAHRFAVRQCAGWSWQRSSASRALRASQSPESRGLPHTRRATATYARPPAAHVSLCIDQRERRARGAGSIAISRLEGRASGCKVSIHNNRVASRRGEPF